MTPALNSWRSAVALVCACLVHAVWISLFVLWASSADALTTLYVDTASTAGTQDCTTSTPGSSGTAACATLRQAIDKLPDPLGDAYKIVLLASTGAADTQDITQSHWDFDTSATNYLWIYVDPTYRHKGYYDATKYRLEVSDTSGIYNNDASHVRIEGLQVKLTVTTSSGATYNGLRLATANNTTANIDHRYVDDLVWIVVAPGATDNAFAFNDSNPVTFTGTSRRINCIAIGGNTGFGSDGSTWARDNLGNYNVTAYGNEFPFQDLQICVNCLGAGATNVGGVFVSTGTTGHSNNASDDGSAGGTNARINQTFSFFNAVEGDYRLKTSDAGAKDFGLSDPLSGVYSDDITGYTRSGSWDIGAWETRTATAALTGTVTASITETDVVNGGKTIILTVDGDSFVDNTGAIQYVGGQDNSFAGTTSNTDITFSLDGGLANITTPAANDLVTVCFCTGSTADRTLSITNTAGTAYTLIGSELYADDTFDTNMRCAYRFMPATPETAVRFAGGTGNAADAGTYAIKVYRNVDQTTPIDVTTTTATGINTRLADPPSITPSTAGAVIQIVGCGAGGTLTADYTNPGNLDDWRTDGQSDTNDSGIGSGHRTWTSGAHDQAAFTGGGTDTTSDSWAAVSFALRPATASAFDNARDDLRDNCDSAQAEATGWDALKTTTMPVANVVRTSDTVVTVTLQAAASYNITAQETITCTVPAVILSGATATAATPTFTIDATGAATCPGTRGLLGVGCEEGILKVLGFWW